MEKPLTERQNIGKIERKTKFGGKGMKTSFKKNLKRLLCVGAVALMIGGTSFTFASCDSSSSKVDMKVSFNGSTYTLSYRLYNKFFPQTVKHFTELVNKGFYNGLSVHDYKDGDMYVGEYKQTDGGEKTDLTNVNYFETVKSYSLTQSVFLNDVGTNTLYGEFDANGFAIQNNDKNYGKLKEGALVMYYQKAEVAKDSPAFTAQAQVKQSSNGKKVYKEYALNCATSVFYISSDSDSAVNKNYTVFAELYDDGAKTSYKNLMSAIHSYTAGLDEEKFTEEKELPIFVGDPVYGDEHLTKTYNVPVEPIVIQKVSVSR